MTSEASSDDTKEPQTGVVLRVADYGGLRGQLLLATGERRFVVGPSGSGKSRLLRCIAGLDDPALARIELAGRSTKSMSSDERRALVALLPQHLPALSMSAAEFRDRVLGFEVNRNKHDQARLSAALDALEVSELDDRPLELLSGGERQRLALATLLSLDRVLYLLDEPSVGLDAARRAIVKELIEARRAAGAAVLWVTHDDVSDLPPEDLVELEAVER